MKHAAKSWSGGQVHTDHTHLSHRFPVIKSPVDCCTLRDLDLRVRSAFNIRPDLDWAACPVPYFVWCIAASGFLEDLVSLFAPYIVDRYGQFDERRAQIDVYEFLR